MRAIVRAAAAVATALVLVACSGNGAATNAPGGGTNPPAATQSATKVCEEPADPNAPADNEVGVANNEWGPVGGKVGDVITWVNDDGVPHQVVLDDGSCSMEGNIPPNGKRSLIFKEGGIFPFHCGVHPSMKGNIVIGG